MESHHDSAPRHSSTPASRVVEVAAGLIFREGKLLITQRHAGAHLGGLWEFPGGKREPGETFEQCLRRELQEELGCDVQVLELVQSLTHSYPEKTVHLQFYRCRWLAHEPQAIDCAAVQWVMREELSNFEFPAADAKLLQLLRLTDELWRSI